MDANDFIWGLAVQNLEYCRHHENQRQGVTNFAFVASGILVSIIGMDQRLNTFDALPAGLLVIIGLFGAVASHEHYERFNHHYERFRGLRRELEKRLQTDLSAINLNADERNEKAFPYTSKRPLARFWRGLHLLVVGLGVLLLVLIHFAS